MLDGHRCPNSQKLYFASRLDVPHYQVSAKELPSYLASIEALKRPDLEVSHIKKDSDFEGPHLNVFNQLTSRMKDIVKKLPLLELADAVLASTQKDTARGNKCIDVGFASDNNTRRSDEWGGVSHPYLALIPITESTRPY